MTAASRNCSTPSEGVAESIADAAQVRPHGRMKTAPIGAVRDFEGVPSVALAAVADANAASSVLDSRRSSRLGGPITLGALASVLLASNRVVTFGDADDGYTRSWRPNPSAGGRHPIDLLVDAHLVDGLDPGIYWFDPVQWSLRDASDLKGLVADARRSIADAVVTDRPPGAVLFLVAHFERTGSRYDHPASLVWRDAGALMATIQFAAAGACISSCPAGTAGTLHLREGGVDVGAVVLGTGETVNVSR